MLRGVEAALEFVQQILDEATVSALEEWPTRLSPSTLAV